MCLKPLLTVVLSLAALELAGLYLYPAPLAYRPSALWGFLFAPGLPEDDIPELLKVLRENPDLGELQARGCLSLVGTLSKAKDEVFMPASVVISSALRLHGAALPSVAGLCCAALAEVIGRLHAAKASSSQFVDASLPWIVDALRAHRASADVAAECLHTVWLLAIPELDKEEVGKVALDAVVQALGATGEQDARVAEFGAGSLWSFGLHKDARHRIISRGAGQVVLGALDKHLASAAVARQAAGALWTMAAQPGNASVVLMHLGAGGALVRALKQHKADASVTETVVGALHSLAAVEENRDALKLLGAVRAVEAAMEAHMEQSDDAMFLAAAVKCIDKINEREPVPEQKIVMGGGSP